jgi:hypothetical protein
MPRTLVPLQAPQMTRISQDKNIRLFREICGYHVLSRDVSYGILGEYQTPSPS